MVAVLGAPLLLYTKESVTVSEPLGKGGGRGEYLDLIIKWIRENRPTQASTVPGHVDQQTCRASVSAFAKPKLK